MTERTHSRLDELEVELLENFPTIQCPLKHKFVGGMYIREIFMPKGTVIVSLTHNLDHPFFILQGKAKVYDENNGVQILQAPHNGTTLKGTRRVLEIEEDCIWCTVHITNVIPKNNSEEEIEKAAAKVVEEVTENRENHLLGGKVINNELQPNLITE